MKGNIPFIIQIQEEIIISIQCKLTASFIKSCFKLS